VSGTDLKKLRFRLRRQGLAELDAWLAPLEEPLLNGDQVVAKALTDLLDLQPVDLLAMMQGQLPVPVPLQSWLDDKSGRNPYRKV
jgi:succinate dehydrogenase flavin-adding protein (antitoxin of CptAB toxin-antitoxin module)